MKQRECNRSANPLHRAAPQHPPAAHSHSLTHSAQVGPAPPSTQPSPVPGPHWSIGSPTLNQLDLILLLYVLYIFEKNQGSPCVFKRRVVILFE